MDKTERKEIQFLESGKMWARYSKDLAKALCDYLASQGEAWNPIELKRYGIIRLPCTLEHKVDALQSIHIESSRYVCETIATIPLAGEGSNPIEHRIKTADEINATLEQGRLVVDRAFGNALLVTTYEPVGQVTQEELAEFLEYSKRVIKKYVQLLLEKEDSDE